MTSTLHSRPPTTREHRRRWRRPVSPRKSLRLSRGRRSVGRVESPSMGRCRVLAGVLAAFAAVVIVAGPAAAADPPLETADADLAAALACPPTFVHPEHPAVLLVHGTGSTPDE